MAGSGVRLPAREGTSAVRCALATVLFGGESYGNVKTNEVWWINDERMEWQLQETFGDVPEPRSGQCAVHDPVRNR